MNERRGRANWRLLGTILATCVGVLLLASAGQGQESVLQGRVVMGTQAVPLNGVRVVLIGPQGSAFAATFTDSQGLYRFSGVPQAGVRVQARLSYREPATSVAKTIINWPDWNPDRAFLVEAGQTRTVPLIVYPDPVVLHPGWRGRLTAFTTLQAYLEANSDGVPDKAAAMLPAFLSFPMPSIVDDPINGYDNRALDVQDHDRNADKLEAWLNQKVRPLFGNWMPPAQADVLPLTVVGHSMGGVIVRAWITKDFSGAFPEVVRLVSMDGIQGGTAIAKFFDFPALREDALNGIADNFGCPPNYVVDAWNEAHQDFVHPWLLWTAVPDPRVLPDRSPWGFGRVYHTTGVASSCEIEWMTGARVVVGDSHKSIHENPDRLRETAEYLARATVPPNDPAPLLARQLESDLRWATTLQASSGTSPPERFSLDAAGPVHMTWSVRGIGAAVQMRSERGERVVPTRQWVTAPSSDLRTEHWEFDFLPAQEYTLSLTAAADEAEARLLASFSSPYRLAMRVDTRQPRPGANVRVTAAVVDDSGVPLSVPDALLTVQLRAPDRTLQFAELRDDGGGGDPSAGDGWFSGTFGPLLQAGRWQIHGRAVFGTGARPLQRVASSEFVLRPRNATLVGLPEAEAADRDGDGRADTLLFRQELRVWEATSLKLTGTLEDLHGRPLGRLQTVLRTAKGEQLETAVLSFPTAVLVRHDTPGPWRLTDVTLFDLDHGTLAVDRGKNSITPSWRLSDLAPPQTHVGWLQPSEIPWLGDRRVVLGGSGLLDVREVWVAGEPVPFTIRDDHALVFTVPAARPPAEVRGARTISADVTLVTPWKTVIVPSALRYLR